MASQGYVGSGQQGFVGNTHVVSEAIQPNESRHLTHSTQADRNPYSPSLRTDRPWASLQTMHTRQIGPLGVTPAQSFYGFVSTLDVQIHFDILAIQQTTSNEDHSFQGFAAPGTIDSTTSRQTPGASGSFETSYPSNGFVLPEVLAPNPSQLMPGPNLPFNDADPSLSIDLDQNPPSQIATQSAETASVASASSTRSGDGGRGRRTRGEVRRGQPKPSSWTDDEVRILLRMYAERKDNESVSEVTKKIAQTLGKSTGAVEAKHWRLRGSDPKASKNKRGGCGGTRGGRGGHNGRRGGSGGAGGAGSAGLAA